MRKKALFLGVLGVAMLTAVVGLWRNSTPTSAGIPLPLQPFNAQALGGIDTTQLGMPIQNYTVTQNLRGERAGVPWIFSGPGFVLDSEASAPNGTNIGSLGSTTDTLCVTPDSATPSVIGKNTSVPPNYIPFDWLKATTTVQGTADEYLVSLMPPFSWIYRHEAVLETFWLLGATPLPISPPLHVNTVYTSVPWSANNGAFTATTILGGNPDLPDTTLCSDTPTTSVSLDQQYSNPVPKGDSGAPCADGTCSDAMITGMWTDTIINLASGTTTKTVTSKVLNNGPAAGVYAYHWDIEVTNPTVVDANWTGDGKVVDDAPAALAPNVVTTPTKNIDVTCNAAGEGLVVLKGVLWPVIPGTTEVYPDDNTAIFVIQVICGGVAGPDPIDKEVIWIKQGAFVDPLGWTEEGSKIEALIGGDPVSVMLHELKSNHDVAPAVGTEWIVAETAETIGPAPLVSLVPSVTATAAFGTPVVIPATLCGAGQACITYDVTEQPGQTTVDAQLDIVCPAGIPEGAYSIVLKGIDAPKNNGESKPFDNAARAVIAVYCWASPASHADAQDGIDDASGLYVRWTIFKSVPDVRKPYQSPPSFTSDGGPAAPGGVELPFGGYVERKATLECYWEDMDGCNGGADCSQADPNFITGPESQQDVDIPGGIAAIDSDGDCLQDFAAAQPGHPTEVEAGQPAGNCPVLPWAEQPANAVVNSIAADADCDGLLDGVERGYGSNPKLADTDADGADDFQEIFQFTNPLNPDTDGDGFLDKPITRYTNDGSYGVAPDTTFDNCPTIYNPDQLNTDGIMRDNGPKIPGTYASNPGMDKMGDACDPDDDNDGLPDVAEAIAGTNPLNPNTDGNVEVSGAYDRCVDGVEVNIGKDPLDPASKCALFTADQLKFYRACRWNQVDLGVDGGLWDDTYTGGVDAADRTEWDADGDGIQCQNPPGSGTIGDKDADDGVGDLASPPLELTDIIEIQGYYTAPANKDTDGDACEDWIEAMDINGDRKVTVGDQTALAKRGVQLAGFEADVDSDVVYDVNKDGKISVGDQTLMAKNTCIIKPFGVGCPGPCPSEK